MAYQMAATAVTLDDLEGHSRVADVFKCNPSNMCATFYTISTDSVLARFLCISRDSCRTKVDPNLELRERSLLFRLPLQLRLVSCRVRIILAAW